MSVKVVGVPQLPLLEAVVIAQELGIPIEYLLLGQGPQSVRVVEPEVVKYFGPIKLCYLNSIDALALLHEKLKKVDTLVLLQASTSSLVENNLDIYEEGLKPFSLADLKKLLLGYQSLVEFEPTKRSRMLAHDILVEKNKGSLLQKLQNSFYRIRDPDERRIAQQKIYSYLAGNKGSKPDSGFEFLDNIVRTDFAIRFRKAVQVARRLDDPDEASRQFSIDRFEIAFVLSKLKK